MSGDAWFVGRFGNDAQQTALTVSAYIAAGAILAAAIAVIVPPRRHSPAAIAALLAAGASGERSVELRVSGRIPWAPYHHASHAVDAPSNMRGADSAEDAHMAGLVRLLSGQAVAALPSLRQAATQQDGPGNWNDLAAALHEMASRYDAPELYAEALTACDRAIALEPRLAEALFNRALILERLGLRDEAREAWQQYLAADAPSGWTVEARQHLAALASPTPFRDQLDHAYDRVSVEPAAADALVARDPFGARGDGVVGVLGRWGNAVLQGDERAAARHLSVARQLGASIVRRGGDRMLERAVAAIDACEPAERARLASAHAEYQLSLKLFQDRRPEAEPRLRHAALSFGQARSPVALGAQYFAANAAFEQGRHDEAEARLVPLLAAMPDEFPAYRAMILWQLANCHTSRADWGAAIALATNSVQLFEQLGERQNASAVRRLLAFMHDQIGDPDTAWKDRLAALRGLGASSSLLLEKAVASIADAAILRREWPMAASFLNIEIGIARRLDDHVQLSDTLLTRTIVRDRLNDRSGALTDIADARVAAASVAEEAYRAYLRIAELRARAMMSGTPSAEAIALLTEAIDFHVKRGDPLMLPVLLLELARALRAAGDVASAMADLERGIEELERHRQSLPQGEARWGAFHSAEELFDDAIDLSMSVGDVDAAFRFTERARARALLESYGRSPVIDITRLPVRTVIAELVALPTHLVIFTATSSGVHAATVDCSRETLAAEVDAFLLALRHDQTSDARRLGAGLYRRLIAPVAEQLFDGAHVVFVPDATTAPIAFSALRYPGGAYFAERHAITIAPSAAAYAAAAERRRQQPVPRSALVLSAPEASANAGTLAFAGAEAQAVAREYANATRVRDDAAELDALAKLGPAADAIHFVGHAVGDDRGFEPASIVLRQNGQERRVRAEEIAKLHLRHTSVVVLAGCSTGRGERRAAEGVISVAHGFLTAGVPSVIATLWPIDDSAASEFFPRLHRRLARGDLPAEALRAMQIDAIRNGDIPISLWAAVQDIGS